MNFKYTILRKFGIGGFLIIISLVILMSGFFPNMIKIIERNTSGEYYQTTANIVAISQARRGHEVTVSFNIPDSQKYTALLDTYVEGMEVGDNVEIYYQQSNPTNITLKGNQFWQAVLFGSSGGILLVISLILLKRHKLKNNSDSLTSQMSDFS